MFLFIETHLRRSKSLCELNDKRQKQGLTERAKICMEGIFPQDAN